MHYYTLEGDSKHEIVGANGKLRPTTIAELADFPDYAITNTGDVISYKWGNERVLKQQTHRQGYKNVRLAAGGVEYVRYIHRLMAQAFLENWDPALQVNHINGIKDDNRLDNLEMVTNGQNQKHAFRLGLQTARKAYQANRSKLTKDQYSYVVDTIGSLTARQVSQCIPLCLESIRRIRRLAKKRGNL